MLTTSLYAAILAIALVLLSLNVIRCRRRFKIALGDDDNFEIKRRVRAQANFAEYTPMFLILLGMAEFNYLPEFAIHVFGTTFFIGRAMHAHSLLKEEQYTDGKITASPVWRMAGMATTFTCILSLASILILQYVMRIL